VQEFSGYTVSYDRSEAGFPVYAAGSVAAALIVGAFVSGNWIFLALGLVAFIFAYYHFPLTETGKPRLGANQYGVFIDGFGLVRWGAIERVDVVVIAVRALTLHELQIALNRPLPSALMADWRKVPWWRVPMRLPWKMTHDNVIRITLDPFDQTPEDVHWTLLRMWRHYRS